MLSLPVCPRGHSNVSVRAGMTATSDLSDNSTVSSSLSVRYQSQSNSSLPRKSRLLSSAIQATSPGVTSGTNADGLESSTLRVRSYSSASWYARRPDVIASRSTPNVWWNRLVSRSTCGSDVAPNSS